MRIITGRHTPTKQGSGTPELSKKGGITEVRGESPAQGGDESDTTPHKPPDYGHL